MENTLIPNQHSGFKKDFHEIVEFELAESAVKFFSVARSRLMDINNWQHICEGLTSSFKLTDSRGILVERLPQVGDYLQIDIPGPGPITGDNYDWVQIEAMEDQEGVLTSLRVRPAYKPGNNEADIAHFLDETSTSTFLVYRNGTQVGAEVHGRNEKPNTAVHNLVDKLRNISATIGNWIGFSDIQWKNLLKGLLKV